MESQMLPSKALLKDFNEKRYLNDKCMYPGCVEKPIRTNTMSKSSTRWSVVDAVLFSTTLIESCFTSFAKIQRGIQNESNSFGLQLVAELKILFHTTIYFN